MSTDDSQYIYLLQTREFINSNLPVYKVGKTKQINNLRFNSYPKGSKLLSQLCCKDCDECEKQILSLFDKKYKKRTDFGNEYYEGNYKDMKRDIFDIIEAENDKTYNEVNDFCNFEEEVGVEVSQLNNDIENMTIEQPSNYTVPSNGTENEIEQPINDTENDIEQPINATENDKPRNEKIKENTEPLIQSIKTKFYCEKCYYYTNIKQHYEYHCNTSKHKNFNEEVFSFGCKNCNKKFKSNVGLWKHKKVCKEVKSINNVLEDKKELKEEDKYKKGMNIKYFKEKRNITKV